MTDRTPVTAGLQASPYQLSQPAAGNPMRCFIPEAAFNISLALFQKHGSRLRVDISEKRLKCGFSAQETHCDVKM